MCLALIHTKKAKPMEASTVEAAWENNWGDSGGVAYIKDGSIAIRHALKLPRMHNIYQAAFDERDPDSPILVHFRLATHGAKDKTNAHPFTVARGRGALIHNGVISGLKMRAQESDTAALARSLSDMLPSTLVGKKARKRLAKLIGGGNKLVMLTDDGRFSIVNEKAGHWKDGTWYSNDSYDRCPYSRLGGRYGSVRTTGWGSYYDYDDDIDPVVDARVFNFGKRNDDESSHPDLGASAQDMSYAEFKAHELLYAAWDCKVIDWAPGQVNTTDAAVLWFEADTETFYWQPDETLTLRPLDEDLEMWPDRLKSDAIEIAVF